MTSEQYRKLVDELIELLDEGVYIVDKDGVGIHYNRVMARTEKLDVQDVLGKKFHEAFPDFKPGESTIYKALTRKQKTKTDQQTYKNLYGKEVTTENATVPVVVDGKVVAAIEISRDMTELRTMSDAILRLREETAQETPAEPRKIKSYSFEDIYGENEAFKEAVNKAAKAARNDASVFIYGETGTGKELFAQSIHNNGKRAGKPFIAQNCAAIPETLLESLLFGTTKGSFTGAVDRAGLFEQANGGTLLLDEISAMPYDLQSKLLRVLQESYIRRVGGEKDIPINVRIIATVNEPPAELIQKGFLRKDLYYRLNVINISIPPLRERPDDIQMLTERFMEKFNKRFDKQIWMISDGALRKLRRYDYPGNVRELENIIEQAISMADNEHVLTEKLISTDSMVTKLRKPDTDYQGDVPLDKYMEEIEKRIISGALIETKGNISKAADSLQIKRQTLQHKLRKYKISLDSK